MPGPLSSTDSEALRLEEVCSQGPDTIPGLAWAHVGLEEHTAQLGGTMQHIEVLWDRLVCQARKPLEPVGSPLNSLSIFKFWNCSILSQLRK